jgi:Glycosyl transferase family 11
MIIVKLSGGLGNQLFQFAAGKALSIKKKSPLWLDISGFGHLPEGTTPRVYELNSFGIKAGLASPSQIEKVAKPKGLKRLLNKVSPYYRQAVYQEPFYHYDIHFPQASSNTILEGYWQSEKYFKDACPVIRSELQVTASLSPATAAFIRRISNVNAVSVHVRRGDYVSDQKTHQYHGACDLNYYRKSLQLITQKTTDPELFVFSDDIAWAKENLLTELPINFVDHNDDVHAYEDLYLMSHCKHNIIANSSFSWWGAWLNNHPGKIVIAPSKWFNKSDADTKDLLPAEWLTI